MKVIIAGSRTFSNYNLLEAEIDNLRLDITEIICGEAKGADSLGKMYAIRHNIPVKSFPAKWDLYGKRAGMIRNQEMGDYADYLIAFWDGQSKGTKHMIDYMRILGKHGHVVLFT